MEKMSYSKIDTYEQCKFKYKLVYKDGHFVDTSTIATDFGTLIHYVEETIANDIIANNHEPNFMIDDQKYIDLFINTDIDNDEETIWGVKKLKEKYPKDFYTPDKSGFNYEEKANDYLNNGIYFLRDFLAANRNIHLVDTEKEFNLEYRGYNFHGFIDRVFVDLNTGNYIVEDIKTWPKIDGHDVITPLQFVIYTEAAAELYGIEDQSKISCSYYLPLAMSRYPAGTKGYMSRGFKKIDKLLNGIEAEDYTPKPSALCYWCQFSRTNPNQPEEGKNLCPYYSLWTKDSKTSAVDYEWMGMENHKQILEDFIKKHTIVSPSKPVLPEIQIKNPRPNILIDGGRFFLIRR